MLVSCFRDVGNSARFGNIAPPNTASVPLLKKPATRARKENKRPKRALCPFRDSPLLIAKGRGIIKFSQSFLRFRARSDPNSAATSVPRLSFYAALDGKGGAAHFSFFPLRYHAAAVFYGPWNLSSFRPPQFSCAKSLRRFGFTKKPLAAQTRNQKIFFPST